MLVKQVKKILEEFLDIYATDASEGKIHYADIQTSSHFYHFTTSNTEVEIAGRVLHIRDGEANYYVDCSYIMAINYFTN